MLCPHLKCTLSHSEELNHEEHHPGTKAVWSIFKSIFLCDLIGVIFVLKPFYVYIHVHTLFLSEGSVSADCQEQAVSFLCLYQFPIFSCLEQQVILPTKENCERIIESTCRVEFTLAIKLGFDYLLPQCDTLPNGIDTSGMLKACTVNMSTCMFCGTKDNIWLIYILPWLHLN